MSRKRFLSLSALVSIVIGFAWAAPQVSGQVFVGTPIPQQFSGQGQPSTDGEQPSDAQSSDKRKP